MTFRCASCAQVMLVCGCCFNSVDQWSMRKVVWQHGKGFRGCMCALWCMACALCHASWLWRQVCCTAVVVQVAFAHQGVHVQHAATACRNMHVPCPPLASGAGPLHRAVRIMRPFQNGVATRCQSTDATVQTCSCADLHAAKNLAANQAHGVVVTEFTLAASTGGQ